MREKIDYFRLILDPVQEIVGTYMKKKKKIGSVCFQFHLIEEGFSRFYFML